MWPFLKKIEQEVEVIIPKQTREDWPEENLPMCPLVTTEEDTPSMGPYRTSEERVPKSPPRLLPKYIKPPKSYELRKLPDGIEGFIHASSISVKGNRTLWVNPYTTCEIEKSNVKDISIFRKGDWVILNFSEVDSIQLEIEPSISENYLQAIEIIGLELEYE